MVASFTQWFGDALLKVKQFAGYSMNSSKLQTSKSSHRVNLDGAIPFMWPSKEDAQTKWMCCTAFPVTRFQIFFGQITNKILI